MPESPVAVGHVAEYDLGSFALVSLAICMFDSGNAWSRVVSVCDEMVADRA